MADANFIYIADVYCPWCYAFAPIMRQLADENPEFPVKVVGGNLISRPMTLKEDAAVQHGLADFWRTVGRTSGRSLAGAIYALETGRDVRMYSPGADEILAVLKRMAPGHELEQLFELEEMFYGRGLDIFTEEALTEIAARWNLEPASLESALDQHAALEATKRNLAKAAELMGEITSYPSVILQKGKDVAAVSRGYVRYETVAARLEDVERDLGIEPITGEFCSWQEGCTSGHHTR